MVDEAPAAVAREQYQELEMKLAMCRVPTRTAQFYKNRIAKLSEERLLGIAFLAEITVTGSDEVVDILSQGVDEFLFQERKDVISMKVRDRDLMVTGGLASAPDAFPTEAYPFIKMLEASGITQLRRPDIRPEAEIVEEPVVHGGYQVVEVVVEDAVEDVVFGEPQEQHDVPANALAEVMEEAADAIGTAIAEAVGVEEAAALVAGIIEEDEEPNVGDPLTDVLAHAVLDRATEQLQDENPEIARLRALLEGRA